MTVEINEVAVLILLGIGYIPILMTYSKHRYTKWMFWAYTALLVGATATVAEGFWFNTQLNFIEHSVGVMLAGVLFWWTARANNKKVASVQNKIREKVK